MRISKSAVLLSAVFAALALFGVPASATAAPIDDLTITQVGYNAYGSDTVWNRNQEFVDVKASADVNVKDLLVTDQWGKGHVDDNDRACNTKVVTSLVGVTSTPDSVILPAGHTIRIYSGRGTAAMTGSVHSLFMDSRCGYHGHIWGNGGDAAWIRLGGVWKSFAYDFDNGYTVRP